MEAGLLRFRKRFCSLAVASGENRFTLSGALRLAKNLLSTLLTVAMSDLRVLGLSLIHI